MTLVRNGYGGWISIEMRSAATGNVPRVAAALAHAIDCYAPLLSAQPGS